MWLICLALTLYWWILLIYVLVSWAFLFGMRRPYVGIGAKLLDALDAVVLPVLRPLRNLIPPVRMGGVGLDLSIIVAFVILSVLRVVLHC
jgi:YggT family protein